MEKENEIKYIIQFLTDNNLLGVADIFYKESGIQLFNDDYSSIIRFLSQNDIKSIEEDYQTMKK